MLEGVPYLSFVLSSLRLPRVVAVVLFLYGLAHWMEHFFDSADDTTHLVVFFRACNLTCALHEHQIGQLFLMVEQTPTTIRGEARGDAPSVPSST